MRDKDDRSPVLHLTSVVLLSLSCSSQPTCTQGSIKSGRTRCQAKGPASPNEVVSSSGKIPIPIPPLGGGRDLHILLPN